jgi:hypothetical protein
MMLYDLGANNVAVFVHSDQQANGLSGTADIAGFDDNSELFMSHFGKSARRRSGHRVGMIGAGKDVLRFHLGMMGTEAGGSGAGRKSCRQQQAPKQDGQSECSPYPSCLASDFPNPGQICTAPFVDVLHMQQLTMERVAHFDACRMLSPPDPESGQRPRVGDPACRRASHRGQSDLASDRVWDSVSPLAMQ